jgi:hypothetical protein
MGSKTLTTSKGDFYIYNAKEDKNEIVRENVNFSIDEITKFDCVL